MDKLRSTIKKTIYKKKTISPDDQNLDLFREIRKEMDKSRSAIKKKTEWSVDRLVRATDSPFTTAVLECPVPSKFRLPQLESFDGLKDPQDHLNTFKMTLGLQQPLMKYCVVPFPPLSKELQENGSPSYQRRQWITLSSCATPSYATSSGDNVPRGQQITCSLLGREKRRP